MSRTAGRRLSVVAADQAVSAASSLLVTLIAAQLLDVAAFGLFGLIFICFVAAQGVLRAWVGEPTLLHHDDAVAAPGPMLSAAVALAGCVGVVLAAVGAATWSWHAEVGQSLVLIGVLMPALTLQDYGRFLGFAQHRPQQALALDLLRVALLVVAAFAVWRAEAGVVWLVAAWAGSGAGAGLLTLVHQRVHLARPSLRWLRSSWSFSWRYLLSFAATQGAALATTVAIAGIGGAADLGAVRGVLLLTGLFTMVQAAFMAAGVAEVAASPEDRGLVRGTVRKGTLLMGVIAALNGVVLLSIPTGIGELILADTWASAERLFVPAALHLLALGMITGVRSALMGRRAIRVTMVIDVVSTIAMLAAVIVGVTVNGALGAWWALAWVQVAVAAAWWLIYLAHIRSFAPVPPLDAAAARPTTAVRSEPVEPAMTSSIGDH
ncbi:hypothetical protein ACLM5J_00410 [Nocardioides sp. Bht2]|uniref:hypothetical protein n=1 Tax=Nocardioides sp. Bht2 TaxID=3392297 RepID=UPI0039B3A79E